MFSLIHTHIEGNGRKTISTRKIATCDSLPVANRLLRAEADWVQGSQGSEGDVWRKQIEDDGRVTYFCEVNDDYVEHWLQIEELDAEGLGRVGEVPALVANASVNKILDRVLENADACKDLCTMLLDEDHWDARIIDGCLNHQKASQGFVQNVLDTAGREELLESILDHDRSRNALLDKFMAKSINAKLYEEILEGDDLRFEMMERLAETYGGYLASTALQDEDLRDHLFEHLVADRSEFSITNMVLEDEQLLHEVVKEITPAGLVDALIENEDICDQFLERVLASDAKKEIISRVLTNQEARDLLLTQLDIEANELRIKKTKQSKRSGVAKQQPQVTCVPVAHRPK